MEAAHLHPVPDPSPYGYDPDTGHIRCQHCADNEDLVEGFKRTVEKQSREIGTLTRKLREEDDPNHHPLGNLIVELIQRWMQATNHTRSKVSADRVKMVKARLKDGYTIEQIEMAIDGVGAYPFVVNGSRVKDGQKSHRHDRLGIPLGGGEKVEEFAILGHQARKEGWTPEEGWK